jgi:excisionase family DNA binding protein
MTGDQTSEALWTIDEAAQYLRVPVSAVYKMTARSARLRIPHVRLSGRLRFRPQDLRHWVELLTVSNIHVLEKVRSRARRTIDGQDSQTEVAQR